MASEYMKMKARQALAAEEPQAPAQPLTRREKIENWLHYHWLYLVIGAVLLWIGGSMLWDVLGIGRIAPDYRVAYVSARPLSEAQAARLEEAFAAAGEDVNGDGRVKVTLTQYTTARSGDQETALYYNYAADTLLLADITAKDSYFFLTDDADGLQSAYQILANLDGTPPAETDHSAKGKTVSIASCPALAELAEDEALAGLSLGRRCFYGEAAQNQTENDTLWQRLTKGATP